MLLVFNWKMNPETLKQAKNVFEATVAAMTNMRAVRAIVAPPAVFLHALKVGYRGRTMSFAIQNIHFDTHGAHTGDISARQAKDIGASYAIIGHAERRALGENDDDVRKKVKAILREGMSAIVCIGENDRDHSGIYLELIKKQLITALIDVDKKQIKKIIIAYEPVWAIGAAEPMKATQMHEMTILIRKILWEKYGRIGLTIPILYGGSVLGGKEAESMAKESEVNGFLLGRVSVDPVSIEEFCSAFNQPL